VGVARRSSPDRIYTARRVAVRNRFVQERRISGQRAEALVASWEAEAARRGLDPQSPDFWKDAGPWIRRELDKKKQAGQKRSANNS
jgi:hypothetical protein